MGKSQPRPQSKKNPKIPGTNRRGHDWKESAPNITRSSILILMPTTASPTRRRAAGFSRLVPSWFARSARLTASVLLAAATRMRRISAAGPGLFLLGLLLSSPVMAGSWAPQTSGTTINLKGVWGSGSNSVWATGLTGTILKWNGTAWAAQTSGTTESLFGVRGSGASDVWAVGSSGTIQKWNGTAWAGQTSGITTRLQSVWASDASNVWAVGASGNILKGNGSSWTTQASNNLDALNAVWGASAFNVWAVGRSLVGGSFQGLIRRWNSATWSSQTFSDASEFYGVWASDDNNAWAVGESGKIRKWNGSAWTTQTSGTTEFLFGVWGTDANNVWAVGSSGAILKWNGSEWSAQTSGTTGLLNGVWGTDANNVWAVGDNGTILKWTDSPPGVAPTVTAPATFTVTEDVAGNLLYTGTPFADPDSASLTVTLSVTDGTITGNAGNTVTVGGTAIARTFSGTVANLNAYFTTAGRITYTTALNNTTARTLTTLVSDGSLSNSANSTINITPVNDAPALTAIGVAGTEDTTLAFTAVNFTGAYTDPESTPLASITVVTLPASGTLKLSAANVTANQVITAASLVNLNYVPAANENGAMTFTVTASDGSLSSSPATTVTMNLTAVNDPPTLTVITNPAAINEDAAQQTVNLAGISAGPGETQTLTVTAISSVPALILNPSVAYTSPSATGSLTYTPVANASGSAVITVTVNDGQAANNTFSRTFTVTVNPVNDPPSFTKGADQTVAASAGAQSVANWATGISPGPGESGQAVSFTITGNTNAALFTAGPTVSSTGILTYTPAASANGSATVSLKAVDNGSPAAESAVQSFTITVTPVLPNRPPSFTLPAVPEGLWEWGQFIKLLGTEEWKLRLSPEAQAESDWQSVACGHAHTVAVKRNGELWGWGSGALGQLGTGGQQGSVKNNTSSPVRIGTATDWQSVACGTSHTVAVKRNGQLWAWGGVGPGSSTSPVQVGTDTDWRSVACGGFHTVAVKGEGQLWAWGANVHGQLGINNTTWQNSPVRIGSDADWQSVACGAEHTVAVKKNGQLWAWGRNSEGQLGINSTDGKLTPVPVNMDTDWLSVACGTFHTVAVKRNGQLWAWGDNSSGQLGINSTAITRQIVPVKVGTGADWHLVACGVAHTVALKRDSRVKWVKDGGQRTIPGFAADIRSGPPGEPVQTVGINVTTATISGTPTLFFSLPTISADGTLTFTPAAGAIGEAEVTVKLQDNGGTANGGVDTSDEKKFKIRIIPNGVKASTVGAGTIDLVDKVLINDTNGPLSLPNPVTMGGSSGINTLPGQCLTLTGPCTFTTPVTSLNTCGEAEIQCAQFSAALFGLLAQVIATGPGQLALAPAAPVATDLNFQNPPALAPSPVKTTVIGGGSKGSAFGTTTVSKSAGGSVAATMQGSSFGPGASPGKLSGVNGSLEAGVVYEWEISKADGTAGAAPGWDLVDFTGAFTLVPVSGEKQRISLRSLTTANVSGLMENFNKNAPYAWKVISAAGGITGFSPDLFALDTTGIENDFGGGSFGIALQNSNRDLVVTYTPALRTANWTNDATSGIDATRGTLWGRRFGVAGNVSIGGVTMTGTGFTVSSPEFDLAGPTDNYTIDDVNNLTPLAGQGSAELAKRFVYGGNPTTLTFKQLTPGYEYTASIFTVGFDATPNFRLQTFTSGTDSRVLDPNAYGDNAGNRIDYTFTADAATRVLTITPSTPANTFALYGVALRLETILPPVVSAQAVTSVTGTGATLNGTVVSSDARSTFVQRGFVIATTAENPAPELDGPGVTDFPVAGTTGAFSQAITGLLPGTPYSVAAYAENGEGVAYSSVVTFTTTSPVLLPAGAVSWYKAENNAQDSVGTNHATAAATTYAAGRVGQAFSLTGAGGSYLNCTNNASLQLATGTVEAWIKTSNPGSSYRGIMVKQFAYGLFLENNNLIGYDWGGGGGLVSTVNLADNNWHHVALSFTSGSMKLYADGVLVQSRTSFAVSNQSNALVVGAGDAAGSSQNFNGQIDEATIYNRVLSLAEIQSIFNAGAAGKITQAPVPPATVNFSRSGGNLVFGFTSLNGLTYTLWRSENLATWTNTGLPAITGDGTVKSFALPDPSSTIPRRYFRVQVQ